METIKINKQNAVSELAKALKHAGSTDWDVYVNADGAVSTRHNTYDNNGWYEIVDLYSCEIQDGNNKYPGDDDYDYTGAAEWMISEMFSIPDSVEVYDDDSMQFVDVDIELVD